MRLCHYLARLLRQSVADGRVSRRPVHSVPLPRKGFPGLVYQPPGLGFIRVGGSRDQVDEQPHGLFAALVEGNTLN